MTSSCQRYLLLSVAALSFFCHTRVAARQPSPLKPNVVVIYADDLGYGDIGANGATKIRTPNIDRLAAGGVNFTNAHATSATCTPSRFSFLTGKYAWRKSGTGIAPGDAALLIPTDHGTLAGMFKEAGYRTAAIGKWHLGLGPAGGPDWNGRISPGPLEIGFDYCFLMPATADRVPCVYVENHNVVGLDPADPIQVSYDKKVGTDPTGAENPELLKMKYSHEHDATIIDGVSRIGWMTGGNKARWTDEEMAGVFAGRATAFIEANRDKPFFLYFATHDIHVPRMPGPDFAGKSGLGPRGDAILQLDWTVGQVMKTLDRLNLTKNTLVIFSSDNGPVLDDGYEDRAAELLNGHTPGGPMRGGKYSAFDAGTRIPLLVSWPGHVKPSVSGALFSQVDLYASLSAMTGQRLRPGDAPDSFNALATLLEGKNVRDYVVEQSLNDRLGIIRGDWKYISPGGGPRVNVKKNIELGNDPQPQLYNLRDDIGERNNVAARYPDKVNELAALLKQVKDADSTRPLQ